MQQQHSANHTSHNTTPLRPPDSQNWFGWKLAASLGCRKWLAAGAAGCLVTLAASAATSPYAGIYSGSFSGQNNGIFAVFVGEDGVGVTMVYSSTYHDGLYNDNFTVNQSGGFLFTAEGTTVNGTISGSSISGSFSGAGGSGTLSGSKRPATGIQANNAGYYVGSIAGVDSGPLRAIVAADGYFGFILMANLGGEDGGTATVNAAGQFSMTSIDGVQISGSVNSATHVASGNWQNPRYAASGTFSATRTRSLPTPTCTYTLSFDSTNRSATAGNGSFSMTASSGCSWSATAKQSWLHTSSTGSGNGTVYYTVDANGGSAFRTGTITVGGQTFTITQGPAGFAWHNVFGWIFNAGSGWYHHNGFGWMWFSSGQWIWSGNLQGWVATMDSTSRTLWSPQFRWLTPSESDPYRVDTTAIGAIYLGQYNGTAITDGWVVSDRFGYVWAAGDGKWFFSNTYGWLGVTDAGGIWCVNQGRFL